MGEAYQNTVSQQLAVDWHALVSSTEAIPTLAPIAILAPFLGLAIGVAVARYAEGLGARRTRKAYAVWAKRTW
jgi:hypothetical protein